MVFHEHDKFATQKARQFKFPRAVMAKCWETLIELELVTPIDKAPSAKVLKQFRYAFSLTIGNRVVQSSSKNDEGIWLSGLLDYF